jgi:hypothetical protein
MDPFAEKKKKNWTIQKVDDPTARRRTQEV